MMGRIGSATKTAQYILMRNGAANRGASLAHGRQSDADADWIADADDKPLRSFSFVSSASAPSARLPVFLIIIEYAAMMMPLLAAWLLCLLQNLSSDGCGLFSCRQSSLMVRCLLYNQCQPPWENFEWRAAIYTFPFCRFSLSLFGFPSIPFFTGRRTYGGFPPSVLYSAPAYYGRGEEFHYCILFI